MCGIAGVIFRDPTRVNPSRASRALETLRHRGPDMEGVLFYSLSSNHLLVGGIELLQSDPPAQVLLLHRRLSIIDLSKGGRQPMVSADGRHALIYNGEIYNYKEIREKLAAIGYSFRTQSDTEVLLTALSHLVLEILPQLVGMFAFVWLDTQTRKIYLVRDFFGIKPLFYAQNETGLFFASEIKTLYELEDFSREINAQSLYDYLSLGLTDHSEHTLFASVKQLLPAHYICWDLSSGNFETRRYLNIDYSETIDVSVEEAAKNVRDLFLDSIRLHLRSDVPIGTALSGGIDSSAIVHATRYLEPRTELHTFSFIAKDSPMSEEKWIDIAARSAQTHSHKVIISGKEILSDIKDLIESQGEPFGSTSIYAQYRVFRLASQHGIKVMPDGQGGDEVFAGYLIYYKAYLRQALKRADWQLFFSLVRGLSQMTGCSGRLRFLYRLGITLMDNRFHQNTLQSLEWRWLDKDWFVERGIRAYDSSYDGSLKFMLHDTLCRTSIPHLLRYEDRNSMRFSVESRVPFLNPRLVSYVYQLPDKYLISEQGITKYIFRRAMQGIVPDAILERRDKIGFATPQRAWLQAIASEVKRIIEHQSLGFLRCKEGSSSVDNIINGTIYPDSNFSWRLINVTLWIHYYNIVL